MKQYQEPSKIEELKQALRIFIAYMNIPLLRQDINNDSNIRWLDRNLAIKNSDNPHYEIAKDLIKRILKAEAT